MKLGILSFYYHYIIVNTMPSASLIIEYKTMRSVFVEKIENNCNE